MADIYAMPNATYMNQSYGWDPYITYVTQVEPLFFPVIFLVIWIVAFVATKSYSSSRAWTFASFLCFVLSIPIAAASWLSSRYIYLFLVMLALGIAWIRIGDSQF